jgi:hypothetical protein
MARCVRELPEVENRGAFSSILTQNADAAFMTETAAEIEIFLALGPGPETAPH